MMGVLEFMFRDVWTFIGMTMVLGMIFTFVSELAKVMFKKS